MKEKSKEIDKFMKEQKDKTKKKLEDWLVSKGMTKKQIKSRKDLHHNRDINVFVNLLNRLNNLNSIKNLDEEENFRLQLLLIHSYTDFIITNLIKDTFNFKNFDENEKFSIKLNLLFASEILDIYGYQVLSKMNQIRDDTTHKFNLNYESIESKVNNLRGYCISDLRLLFDKVELPIQKLLLACIPYINSLRGHHLPHSLKKIESIKIDTKRVSGKLKILFSVFNPKNMQPT